MMLYMVVVGIPVESPKGPVSQRYGMNCGINAIAFVVSYFDMPISLQELAVGIETGHMRERPLTLLAIKEQLQNKKCVVEAYKQASLDDTVSVLERGDIAILSVHNTAHMIGHFYVLVGMDHKHVYLVDPAISHQLMMIRELTEKLEDSYSGLFLHVRRPPRSAEIDLGSTDNRFRIDVQADTGPISIPVRLTNTTVNVVQVVATAGACCCYLGMQPPTISIGPGKSENIELLFDRERFGHGKVLQRVALHIEDGESRVIRLNIEADMPYVPPESVISHFPHQVDFGLVNDASQLHQGMVVTFLLPDGVQILNVGSESDHVCIELKEQSNAPWLPPKQYQEMVVSIKAPQDMYRGHITIHTNCQQKPRIVIPVRYEMKR